MRAALYRGMGKAAEVFGVEEVDRPEPGPGEVLVRVHAARGRRGRRGRQGDRHPVTARKALIPERGACGRRAGGVARREALPLGYFFGQTPV